MSDANFINAYNEVILDNLNAIMKQNFMFQTQIKFLEERVSLVPGFEEKGRLYDLVVIEKTELENRLVSLKNEIENKDTLIKNSSSSDADKHRLQTAVNQQAKELDVLKKNYDEQKEYIKQLEDMLPNSKRKKLGLEVPETLKENIEEVKSTEKVSVKEDDVILKVESSGGTF
jgi:predicted RNase H-like nuclease (RuvC/YqgF family)